MPATVACIAGEEIYRQWQAERLTGESLGRIATPFGPSGEVLLVTVEGRQFHLLPRYGLGMAKTAPRRINDRANMYALKSLGVQCILAWGAGGAITHNLAVGDLVVLSDVVDFTYLRDKTFFEDNPLGYLRQFPVFCPTVRGAIAEVLHEMKLVYHPSGVAAVREGPRLETPAEVKMLATIGAEVVSHTFVPEVFLARELEMCYAGVCYAVKYAETGSRHRPFAAGDLFGGVTQKSDADRLAGVVASISQIVARLADKLDASEKVCDCDLSMQPFVRQYDLPADWRRWFADE
jgi:5'-methylthioadenosine phosphorylase